MAAKQPLVFFSCHSPWSLRSLSLSKGVTIGSMAILAACGGDSDGGANASTNAGTATLDEVYASEDDLPGCTERYDGAVALVDEDSTAFKCEDGKWVNASKVSSSSSWTPEGEGIGSSSSSVSPTSSSGISSSAQTPSSSSVESSSSVAPSSSAKSSSSSVISSSSVASSSSVVQSSSSVASSSSSADNVNCSALLEGKTELFWNWNIPKECRLNPEISYGTMTDRRDGKKYKTVTIGTQTWMAENLNYADSVTTTSLKGKSWCYDDIAKNCDVTGRLYAWAAAMNSVKTGCGYDKTCDLASAGSETLVQGICPDGWHLPSQSEWYTLFTAVGDSSTAGKVLKSQTGWKPNGNGNGTDAFGFSALPAGGRSSYEEFYSDGMDAYFWSSTEYDRQWAYRMVLIYSSDGAYLDYNHKNHGYPVRCLRD